VVAVAAVAVTASSVPGCADSHMVGDRPLPGELEELDLTDEQYLELATWWAEQWGWPDDPYIYCLDGGARLRVGTPEARTSSRLRRDEAPDCHILVRDWYECMDAAPDYCSETRPPECIRPPECVRPGDRNWFPP
jgi:hypothetical protein